MQEYDLVVIGSGPGGYTGAIRASQLGMKVACVERHKTLGGTCLNVGCIPSKSLLSFSEKFYEAKEHFSKIGIKANVKLDLKTMISKKQGIVASFCKGVELLFAKNKITRIKGTGKIIDPNIVEVVNGSESEKIKAKNILIATGSTVANIPNVEIDEKSVVSSTGALSLSSVPKHLIVIGGGVIGLELGSVWNRLGSKVTIVEFADQIVPSLDQGTSKNFYKILMKQGLEFMLNTKVLKTEKKANKVSVTVSDVNGSKESVLSCDTVLVAVGRKPNTKGLNIEKLNIETDKQGRIGINDQFQTNVKNIYAIGDVVRGAMLAHKAEDEAVAAVEIMSAQSGYVNYNLIPSIIYTSPEVASVGKTEEDLKSDGTKYKIGKFPFLANSRAKAVDATDGMVKLLVSSETDRVLGAHIIGADAGTLIAEIVAYMEFGGSAEDIARTCHAHPTLNEAIKEAALDVEKRTINM